MSADRDCPTPRRHQSVAGPSYFGTAASVALSGANAIVLPLVGIVMMIAGAGLLAVDRAISLALVCGALPWRNHRAPLAVISAEKLIERVQDRFGNSCRVLPASLTGKRHSIAIRFSLAHVFAPRAIEIGRAHV